MAQKATNEKLNILMRNNLKECLKHIPIFTSMFAPEKTIKDCLELLGKEASEIISCKDYKARAYYFTLDKLLKGEIALTEPEGNQLLESVQQDPVHSKLLKTILFSIYPIILDSYIYNGFSLAVAQLHKSNLE